MIEEIFEKLLYSLDQQGGEQWGDRWEGKVADSLEGLRISYDNLTKSQRQAIDYSELSTQAAYVFAYAIGRAEFTYQLLKQHRAALGKPIFESEEAKITSLGGGPGSEIAGIVKYLLDPTNGEKVNALKYWVFDKDKHWEHPCSFLIEELSELISIELVFDTLDLSDRKACSKVSLEGDDLLVLSFVISELCSIPEKNDVLECMRGLYKTIDSGSKIFYNDSNASSFYYFFNETRKYVTGLGKASQKNECIQKVAVDLDFGVTYEKYIEDFDATPHLTSDALSKLLVRV